MHMFPRFLMWGVVCAGLAWEGRGAEYQPGPDAQPKEGAPKGKVLQRKFSSSKIYPGTERDYRVYVPALHDAKKPACVMVFLDGGNYINPNGDYRAPVVFDNLIHEGAMPATIGVFVNPGVVPAASKEALPRYNRSLEYDALGDRHARFLLEELLPEVGREFNLSTNGLDRALAGQSSGAICAFNAAWERPEAFTRVFSTIGTYVGLRGGNEFPTLIRKFEPKPLRIFLQDGSNDLNIYGGNWHLANLEMLSALEFAGYEVKHSWGDGGHNGKHGGAVFGEALRWLWADYPKPIARGEGSRQPAMEVLIPGEDWEEVASGYGFTEGPAVNGKGEVFFTDIPAGKIHKIGLDGKVTLFKAETGGANGLMFDAQGNLLACANGKKQIVRFAPDGTESVVADGAGSNDLAVDHRGGIYFSDPDNKAVRYITPGGEVKLVDQGIGFPNGVLLTPDQSLLLVSDTRGRMVYSFQTRPDGGLAHKQEYFWLHMPDGATQSGADGMTVDRQGRLYVATALGVQVCDQAGRVNFILEKPQRAWLSNVAFGGEKLDTLYATCGNAIYKRKTKAQGVRSSQAPILPPKPRL